MIGIEKSKETIDALLNGASMMIEPIDSSDDFYRVQGDADGAIAAVFTNDTFWSKLKIGEGFFVQEEFTEVDANEIKARSQIPNNEQHNYDWQNVSQMQEHQSRYKGVVVDVEVKRVQDLTVKTMRTFLGLSFHEADLHWEKFLEDFIDWFNSQFDVRYEDNPYVFLYTVKRK